MDECRTTFEDLKRYLRSPPLLSKLEEDERLSLYLAVSPNAIHSILVWDDIETLRSIYYMSKILQYAKIRYSKVEKVIYVLIASMRHLQPYFQAPSVDVLTDQPLKEIL